MGVADILTVSPPVTGVLEGRPAAGVLVGRPAAGVPVGRPACGAPTPSAFYQIEYKQSQAYDQIPVLQQHQNQINYCGGSYLVYIYS